MPLRVGLLECCPTPVDDYSVAVDVDGTFTDIVLCNLATNEQLVHKTPSTPDDPGFGLLTGLREVLAANSVEASQVKHVFHGTTIATTAKRQELQTSWGSTKLFHLFEYFDTAEEEELEWVERYIPR